MHLQSSLGKPKTEKLQKWKVISIFLLLNDAASDSVTAAQIRASCYSEETVKCY